MENGLRWKVGIFKKRYAFQMFDDTISSKLPIKLEHGDEARYLVPFVGSSNWINKFPVDFLSKYPKLDSRTLKIQAFTSIGQVFEAKIEKGLRQRLIESALKECNSN